MMHYRNTLWKCLVVFFAAFLLSAIQVGCSADSVFTGEWVLTSWTDRDGEHMMPSRMMEYVPEIVMEEDGKARVMLQNKKTVTGTWTATDNPFEIWLYTNLLDDMKLTYKDDQLVFTENSSKAVPGKMVFSRLDPHSPAGEWRLRLAVSYGMDFVMGEVDYLDQLVLHEDGSAMLFSESKEGEKIRNQTGSWVRKGNDVIFSLQALNEQNQEIQIPFLYLRLAYGMLIKYESHEGQLPLLRFYNNQDYALKSTQITSVKPFLNTTWSLIGDDVDGFVYPWKVMGDNSWETLRFNDSGKVVIAHATKSTELSVVLKDESLMLTGSKEDFRLNMTETGYLKMTSGDSTLYFELLSEDGKVPQLTPMDVACPLDPVITEKKNRTSAAGGEKLSFSVGFTDPGIANKKAKNNTFTWSVTDEEGKEIPGVSIDKKGNLSVKKTETPANALVRAVSNSYGTETVYPVHIISEGEKKAAKIAANPVTGLKLSVKGTAKAGKKITINAQIVPKNAADKTLEWSLEDTDESVATISSKGQLSIAKGVPSWTVIKVVCKALGAPEPLVEMLEITVK